MLHGATCVSPDIMGRQSPTQVASWLPASRATAFEKALSIMALSMNPVAAICGATFGGEHLVLSAKDGNKVGAPQALQGSRLA